MKLSSEFFRLPISFDAACLIAEIEQFADDDWRAHPQGHKGNRALPLIASGGEIANEDTRGPMRSTSYLARCPYLQQVLAALDAPIGRTRLMRIEGHGEATAHVDTNYYWAQRVRVHIPILTYAGVQFLCGDHEVFMDAGECWIFDTWRKHNVINPDDRPRIHLVADTVGSESFWSLVAHADQPHRTAISSRQTRLVDYQPGRNANLVFESQNFPNVMSPWELRWLGDHICADLSAPTDPIALDLQQRITWFYQRWQSLWVQYGEDSAGRVLFRKELQRFEHELAGLQGRLQLTNQVDPVTAIQHWIIRAAVAPTETVATTHIPSAQAIAVAANEKIVHHQAPDSVAPPQPSAHLSFDRPIFLVAAPRSGSSLLFETLASVSDVYTIGGESHTIIEGIASLSPANRGYTSNELTAVDATPDVINQLRHEFRRQLRDRQGQPPSTYGSVRLLEKTPKNALRIDFLAAAFPDARFIYLYREPHESLASIIEAWESGKFVTYPHLPGWHGLPWSLLLVPGWQQLQEKSTAAIAATQWAEANRQILAALATLPRERWCGVSYTQFLKDPQKQIERLCRFADLHCDWRFEGQLPLSRHTLTAPDSEKWRTHAAAIEPHLAGLAHLAQQGRAASEYNTEIVHSPVHIAAPLRSIHTVSFPQLLDTLGISLIASTYQAGRIVILRPDGELLNTHFRDFNKPMGIALDQGRLAIGTELEIREFYDLPAHAHQLSPPNRHDSCFLPRNVHTTGDIQIHEMAWIGPELWFINTRFSCLCTRDPAYSFVPRWRPSFVRALAPDDRCHLNGLAIVDGKPRYVTALGESNQAQGWRAHKRDGGILLDISANTIITRGLSMPHSPRWYAEKLWLLNSGAGSLGIVDPQTGRYEEVARLPGFTRGLSFYGRYAFIGLSQVRESAVFSGIPIAEQPIEQRVCGIWVVDIHTGQTVAFVRFEDALQEIFAVQVLPNRRFPELVTTERSMVANAFILPDTALTDIAQ